MVKPFLTYKTEKINKTANYQRMYRRIKYFEQTKGIRDKVTKRDNNKCVYCKSEKYLMFDHIKPIPKNLIRTLIPSPIKKIDDKSILYSYSNENNIVIACCGCNTSKGHQNVLNWATENDKKIPVQVFT